TTVAELRRRVRRRLLQEHELALDPTFFIAVREQLPRVTRVRVRPKRGVGLNELTQFRYDVTLHVQAEFPVFPAPELGWGPGLSTVADVKQQLETEQPERLVLRRVPNGRIWTELRSAELLARGDGSATIAETLESPQRNDGNDPEAFWRLSEELP